MAKVKELVLKNSGELGQIQMGPITYMGPLKVRIDGNFIPAFTIDLTKPSKGRGILDVIKPTVTILVGNKAYQIKWGERGIKEVDPRIFEEETWLDSLQRAEMLGTIFLGLAIGVGIWKLLK